MISDHAEEASKALKVEWAKTQARALCYWEEVELVSEEMCIVLVYFTWKASWWRNDVGEGSDERVKKGCFAYAERQANVNDQPRQKFSGLWMNGLRALKMDEHVLFDTTML
jgi:hypothetical protein